MNPLPVWAAVELGATEIVALQALPEIPSMLLKPFVLAFRAVFGVNPPVPQGVSIRTILPSRVGSAIENGSSMPHRATGWNSRQRISGERC